MVRLQLETIDIGIHVRLQREVWSELLNRYYLNTDLILVIDPEREEDFNADFAIYRQLDVPAQQQVLEKLKTSLYLGRILSVTDLPAKEAAKEEKPEVQIALF